MNKQQAKQKIKKLVQRYEKLSEKEIKRDYNEERTKNVFIQPLFEALGWNFQDDVWPEKEAIQGRADYAFMLNGLTKFFVEAKSLKTDLDLEIHAKQAIKYSWNKGVAWAALTDFEGIKIFNAQAQSKLLIDKLVFEISYSEYISDFDRLWLLSKESFEKNALDQYAVKHGKKIKKLTVNEKLFSDLKEVRKELTKGFCEWNEKIDKEILEEGVQRIIERLMFIRVLEDKGLEEPVLKPVLREWEENKNIQLFTRLITKFRELDDIYNSDLFDEHACEDWEEYSVKWDKIFSLLYGSQVHEYDFKEIPADILGGVYESYLGHIAQNPIKAGKERDKKEIKTKSRQKRKEQGIYYTPKFIVDYIVENTLGKKLKEVKSMRELKQIKVLDPACGSGSFLNKALQTIIEQYISFNNPGKQETKSEILMSNIYGVDLDPQAVELAKLNLLVSALDKKAKLPDLTGNVRVGNSLISGSEKELKKYF
ncbi:N-6 DNA methylase, partial [Candidatus Parcubacteria bacterium]|nr:N-6 DNA methylase [Candidatus Parcubacteria bacterium]